MNLGPPTRPTPAPSVGGGADPELSGAVVGFLQRGSAPFPGRAEEAARSKATRSHPDQLVARVRSLVEESVDVPVDWRRMSLGDAGRYVTEVMAQRHPELDQTALEALAWNVTFSWR